MADNHFLPGYRAWVPALPHQCAGTTRYGHCDPLGHLLPCCHQLAHPALGRLACCARRSLQGPVFILLPAIRFAAFDGPLVSWQHRAQAGLHSVRAESGRRSIAPSSTSGATMAPRGFLAARSFAARRLALITLASAYSNTGLPRHRSAGADHARILSRLMAFFPGIEWPALTTLTSAYSTLASLGIEVRAPTTLAFCLGSWPSFLASNGWR
jgi:hypothetical protein